MAANMAAGLVIGIGSGMAIGVSVGIVSGSKQALARVKKSIRQYAQRTQMQIRAAGVEDPSELSPSSLGWSGAVLMVWGEQILRPEDSQTDIWYHRAALESTRVASAVRSGDLYSLSQLGRVTFFMRHLRSWFLRLAD